jgi:hypothetical protein
MKMTITVCLFHRVRQSEGLIKTILVPEECCSLLVISQVYEERGRTTFIIIINTYDDYIISFHPHNSK